MIRGEDEALVCEGRCLIKKIIDSIHITKIYVT
jgi:hypothetical protein